ncbi:3-deoxy-D-manno-octulosonic acid transferase [Lutimaribacter sp. EGI FJ00015]|uniref:3-deoxy-D-manno-octulosonic acid transferase n=1 Tax=Lutimaribacter degradans TaxID=2945989 RepID=A0ACC5ZR88_9RHOB|nr:3-deoxy-D-manno-octulosonic acid transferase [Lutimaribacter sp. EGI FJ00013]MCM2560839.1 3-deoxy-D-manno-octulosonic acid transferase [Lutimaribacter sp. EGI FJ00013]MCO0612216.1 3-deoxy-D-manno-octulosonic acid transferase [Lutimaribacter sp. EGI FJ00015]MCO0634664.1 3-deoxy-D-manno-octulosonic acid transferase [Lutimaribacter sp. EGI FJ00014]
MIRRPLPLAFYAALSALAYPLFARRERAKLADAGMGARAQERLGHAGAPRPAGRLVWLHAASVGEALSALPLIRALGTARPGWSFLLTSGTVSSAQIVADRLPPRSLHQFAPIDGRPALRRFLDHWHPDAVVLIESELWPNLLDMLAQMAIPRALLNARISDKTARNWGRAPRTAQALLGGFAMIHCQDRRTADHLRALGLQAASAGQNLKSVAGPLPVDEAGLARLRDMLGQRPVWVASSTHPGEDETMIAAHRALLLDHPDLLLILVPRHPERADGIEALIADAGLSVTRRSRGEGPGGAVYLADTFGETGLWYALAPIVCLCGSFTPVGGHNPFEPAHAGAAILHGPLYANFAEVYADFAQAGGATEVADAQALARAIDGLLTHPARLAAERTAARAFAAAQARALDQLVAQLATALEPPTAQATP